MNPRDDRLYAATLRAAAVAQVRGGQSIQEVAESLQIPLEALANWMRDLQDGSPDADRTSYRLETPEQEELRRLRLENDYLRQQRDLYRKACGIIFVESAEKEARREGGRF